MDIIGLILDNPSGCLQQNFVGFHKHHNKDKILQKCYYVLQKIQKEFPQHFTIYYTISSPIVSLYKLSAGLRRVAIELLSYYLLSLVFIQKQKRFVIGQAASLIIWNRTYYNHFLDYPLRVSIALIVQNIFYFLQRFLLVVSIFWTS